MLTSIRGLLAATLLAGPAFVAVPAFAQEETDPPAEITISGYVQGVSDYRFRGISLSAGDPALQGTININHSSGLYVGAWASSLNAPPYGSVELDLYAGFTKEVAPGATIDVGMLYYAYPNAAVSNLEYFEPYASVSTTLGPVSAKVGVAYAWDQKALGGTDNLYVYTDLGFGIPDVPLAFAAHVGYTDGALSPKTLSDIAGGVVIPDTDGGFDWSLGATYNITDNLSIGAAYVGVEGRSVKRFSDDTVVATIKLAL